MTATRVLPVRWFTHRAASAGYFPQQHDTDRVEQAMKKTIVNAIVG